MTFVTTRSVTLAAMGGLLAGVMAGAGAGLAVASMLPGPVAPYAAPEVCSMPLPSDGIGFHILMDEAHRRGPAAHV